MKRFGQGPDLMIDAFRENHLYSWRARILAKTHLWIQRATGMPGHRGKKMDFHSPVYQQLRGACFGYCQCWKRVSLDMFKEIYRWLFVEGESCGWSLLSSGGGQASSSISRMIPGEPLTPPPCSFWAWAWSTLCWCRARSFGATQRFQGLLSKSLLYKAVNQQPTLSVKLWPAPALLRLDLFYLEEPFEVWLFMHMESSCFKLAGEYTNRGEMFCMIVTGLCWRVAVFITCVCIQHPAMRMLYSVLWLFTFVANVVLFYLLQAVTSSIVTLCPLEAWSMRASSQPSSLPWTCTTRTKPERNPCSFLALFLFFSFLIPIVVYSFHGSPLSEEELLFPEHEPAFSFAQMKTSCGGFWGWHLWADKELCASKVVWWKLLSKSKGSCVGPAVAMQERFYGGPKSLWWTANASLTQASAVSNFLVVQVVGQCQKGNWL